MSSDIPEGVSANEWEKSTKKFDKEKELDKLEKVSFEKAKKPRPAKKKEEKVVVKRIKRDPFEEAKMKLREAQENEYGNPDDKWIKITIPSTGTVGKDCVIKLSETAPKAEVAVSANVQWKKRDKFDRNSDPEIVCRAFILEQFKNVKEIKFKWEDIGTLKQEPHNFLRAGEYMVEARVWHYNKKEETTSRRLVQVGE